MPIQRSKCRQVFSYALLTYTLLSLGTVAMISAVPTPENRSQRSIGLLTGELGMWLPERGPLGRKPLQWLGLAGDRALYVLGGGVLYRAEHNELKGPERAITSWVKVGEYAPHLEWDEGEGITATGPFTPELLSEIERAVGTLIEEEIEGQGDDSWLSEDSASFILEAYINEEDPPLDSPFRVSGIYPNEQGVWIATGAGVWGTNQEALLPIGGSPLEARAVTQAFGKLWVSTSDSLWSWKGNGNDTWERMDQGAARGASSLAYYQDALWILSSNMLFKMGQEGASLQKEEHPQDGLIDLFAGGGTLWLLTTRQLWQRKNNTWAPCLLFPSSPTHAHYSEGHLVIVGQEYLWIGEPSCKQVRTLHRPQLEELGFRDARFVDGNLYAATSQGLFKWRATREVSPGGFELLYLKRAIEALPSFDELYRAALEEAELNPNQNLGARPLLSALLPQVRAQFRIDPSRNDEVPTFSDANRQLTLLQPQPVFQVLFEWDLSFDFLARLFNPELGSAYSELQSQMEMALDQPGFDSALEAELGVPEDWTDDTYTTQAQRLAATSVALQRRQAHKDRSQLRKHMLRLYKEWLDLIYRQWLNSESLVGDAALDDRLRSEEISALLNALTGYQFNLKVPRRKGPR